VSSTRLATVRRRLDGLEWLAGMKGRQHVAVIFVDPEGALPTSASADRAYSRQPEEGEQAFIGRVMASLPQGWRGFVFIE